MTNQPVAIGGAITAALVSLVSLAALVFHLSPDLVFNLNGFIVQVVVVITAVVHNKVVPLAKLPSMPPPSVPTAVLTIPLVKVQ